MSNGTYDLITQIKTPLFRHIKVKGNKSLSDGERFYWHKKFGKHPLLSTAVSKLVKILKGKYNYCGLIFKDEEIGDIDHILPRSLGEKMFTPNLQLVHCHCHDTKTTSHGTFGFTHDKGQSIEKPYEPDMKRPVHKTRASHEGIT